MPITASTEIHAVTTTPVEFGGGGAPKRFGAGVPPLKSQYRPTNGISVNSAHQPEKSMSCAHCHNPQRGFSDGLSVSRGHHSKKLKRSAPTLWNVAFSSRFFWDGRASTLEEQAKGPLFSEDEMAMTPKLLRLRLNQEPYRKLFAQAFRRKERIPSVEEVLGALATFQRTLISFDSRYDRFVFGDENALTASEERGLNIFRSFVTRCTECHTPPLFTNFQMADLGLPGNDSEAEDRQGFKVPTLRNIARTAPYMHRGNFPDLATVIQFYNLGGGRGPMGKPSLTTHWHIRPMGLSWDEMRDLEAFLGSLTDESGMPEIQQLNPLSLKGVAR